MSITALARGGCVAVADVPTGPAAGPIVKWAGGKGRLLPQLLPLLPPGCATMRHVEPFFGGGAMFFARQPTIALLGDINPDLCAMYAAVRDELGAVIAELRALAARHDTAQFYVVRSRYNRAIGLTTATRAAMFIYLNKTCFNGLHRVNKRGEFNVPVGRYQNPRIVDPSGLALVSAVLSRVPLRCASFEAVLNDCRRGDFVYLDPPYVPSSTTSNFTRYARDGFGTAEQHALAEWFGELDRRGCRIMLSNSDVSTTRKLYSGYQIDVVDAGRSINCNPGGRGATRELVIRNY